MYWATRVFDGRDNVDIKALFEDRFIALGRPRDMLLISAEASTQHAQVCVGLPALDLLTDFDGFRPMAWKDLPRAPTLLAGHRDVFQAMFQAAG
jgi:hypothetical protein